MQRLCILMLGMAATMILQAGCCQRCQSSPAAQKEQQMIQTAGFVKMKGVPVQLTGKAVAVGDKAPDFTAVDNDMKTVDSSAYRGKARIMLSVPSLDTPVCNIEARRFNQEAATLGDVKVLVISMDLPFAQKRWCGTADAKNVRTLSDHRQASFGEAYGVLMKNSRLLARAVFVVDSHDAIRHVEIVDEVTHEPDYAAALAAARQVAGK